jgi:hypothetical protein
VRLHLRPDGRVTTQAAAPPPANVLDDLRRWREVAQILTPRRAPVSHPPTDRLQPNAVVARAAALLRFAEKAYAVLAEREPDPIEEAERAAVFGGEGGAIPRMARPSVRARAQAKRACGERRGRRAPLTPGEGRGCARVIWRSRPRRVREGNCWLRRAGLRAPARWPARRRATPEAARSWGALPGAPGSTAATPFGLMLKASTRDSPTGARGRTARRRRRPAPSAR